MNVREGSENTAAIFVYTAASKATGASCFIRIINMDGTKTIDDVSLTEIDVTNSPGEYKYSWTPTISGAYLVLMFETAFSAPVKLETELIEVRSW